MTDTRSNILKSNNLSISDFTESRHYRGVVIGYTSNRSVWLDAMYPHKGDKVYANMVDYFNDEVNIQEFEDKIAIFKMKLNNTQVE